MQTTQTITKTKTGSTTSTRDLIFHGMRIIMGLIFTVFSLNFFFKFMPMPQPTPEAMKFMGAMMATGYFFYLLKIIELAVGIMLLANKFVPLALTIIAPVVSNIFLFHLFLDLGGILLAVILLIFNVALIAHYKKDYMGLISKK